LQRFNFRFRFKDQLVGLGRPLLLAARLTVRKIGAGKTGNLTLRQTQVLSCYFTLSSSRPTQLQPQITLLWGGRKREKLGRKWIKPRKTFRGVEKGTKTVE
jgi:hypothetical protein